jgi:maltooligosyltrehalose trehalohydrolase
MTELAHGPSRAGDGAFEFRVWAPRVRNLRLRVYGERGGTWTMEPEPRGWFRLLVPGPREGDDYAFLFDDGRERPDPASRCQPHSVHGPSRLLDISRFAWSDSEWKGIDLAAAVISEIHVGTFTRAGTFEAAIERVDALRETGITAVELMPVAQFPGARNWGYDGVALYAPHTAYGGAEGLQRFVDACHARGVAVILDVVYNHLGPEGNYLGEFGPYFTSRYRAPWGDAVNFDGPGSDSVRAFFIQNAIMWLLDYHIDALRLDAIHGIYDFSARHILEEISTEFHAEAARLGRKAWLIAESDLNDARILHPRERGGCALDAQWLDEFHHSLLSLLGGPRSGYLADFGRAADFAKALRNGYVHDGTWSEYRQRRFGNSSADRPGRQFVACVQNHDQVANACRGNRLSSLAGVERERLAAVLLCCAPYIPLLFMGQEWGETAPFHYFTSHGDPALVEAVREGRRREFAAFTVEADFHDPQDEATFEACRLDWSKRERQPHSGLLDLYRRLLSLRRAHLALRNCRKDLTDVSLSEQERWLVIERSDPAGSRAVIAANLAARPCDAPAKLDGLELALWVNGEPAAAGGTVRLAPWAAAVWVAGGNPA